MTALIALLAIVACSSDPSAADPPSDSGAGIVDARAPADGRVEAAASVVDSTTTAPDSSDPIDADVEDLGIGPEPPVDDDAGGTGAPCSRDTDCDDGNLCNGRERCDPRRGCLPPVAPESCDDGDPCTLDLGCDPVADACRYACDRFSPRCDDAPICHLVCATDNDCTDGRFCSDERCIDGLCRGGRVRTCDDGDPCTIELGCDLALDACRYACNDRNPDCDCSDAGP